MRPHIEPTGTGVRETVKQIETFRQDMDALVAESTSAAPIWEAFRPRVQAIERLLSQIESAAVETADFEARLLEVKESWADLQEPFVELVESVRHAEQLAQQARRQRVRARLGRVRATAVQGVHNTFDALSQNIHNLAREQ